MKKYRKKPVVIEAICFQYSKFGISDLLAFCGSSVGRISKERHPSAIGQVEIGTLEDGSGSFMANHIAIEGDYIIKGVQGKFYACKPDIFKATYEEVEV